MRISHLSCVVCFSAALLGAPACGQDDVQQQTGQSEQAGKQGRIRIDETEHDFGERLAEDPTIVDLVPVHNDGEGPLTITAVTTTCGCVVGSMKDSDEGSPVTIPPGESRDLELRLNPAGWSGNKPTIITVRSDDPLNPEVRIRMKAAVKSAIRIDPSPVAFGEAAKGEKKEIILKVAGRTEDFEVYAATVAGTQGFEVEPLETETVDRDGEMVGETSLRVTLLPTATVGEHNGIITVRTTDRARRLRTVMVTAAVLGDLEFDTPRIAIDPLQMGESATQRFRLINRAGESFRILDIEEQDDKGRMLGKAKAKVTKIPEEEEVTGYDVEITIDARRPEPGALAGNIIFTTDLPLEEKVRIRYLGRILPPGVEIESDRRGGQ